tara:strand:- start:148516 stop:149694 length:1179 start_codon:yes stop_codon:yes gene_type:complete
VASPASYSIDDLVVGTSATESLHDQRGTLLVPSGLAITDALIATLRARGVTTLKSAKQSSPSASDTSDPDARDLAVSPVYSDKQKQRIRSSFQASTSAVESLVRSIGAGENIDLRDAERQVDNFINELVDDPDPVLASALEYEANLKLAKRCVQFSVLAMGMGLRLKIPVAQVRILGSAAMIHDCALFDLPFTSRFPHQIRNESQRRQYLQHPLVAKQMLQFADRMDPEINVLVTQVHELLDGGGFPMRLKAAQIHPLARILCVADAYLTMTSPPKGCARIVPCDAVAYLISGASRGQYSAKAVNGLLKAVTTYPIGSIVELSDTTKARVIRSDGDDFASPILESLDRRGRIIRLKDENLFIARPIISAEMHEVRLPDAYDSLGQGLDTVSV